MYTSLYIYVLVYACILLYIYVLVYTYILTSCQGFCKKKGYSNKTRVTKVADGGEPTEFKNLFKSWPVPQASGKAYIAGGKIGKS